MIAVHVKRISKNLISSFEKLHFQFLMLFIPSCGGNKPDGLSEKIQIGFSADYIAPTANFDATAPLGMSKSIWARPQATYGIRLSYDF